MPFGRSLLQKKSLVTVSGEERSPEILISFHSSGSTSNQWRKLKNPWFPGRTLFRPSCFGTGKKKRFSHSLLIVQVPLVYRIWPKKHRTGILGIVVTGLLLQNKVAKTGAYSNRWQSGYYAYEIDSDCGTMELPALIHVRAYLYAGTSRKHFGHSNKYIDYLIDSKEGESSIIQIDRRENAADGLRVVIFDLGKDVPRLGVG
ncbi:hypothetical protein HAX54_004093 [Datura stramonium]|uniref:Ribosomal protein L10 n=1 Tax=Datura stramonium TaxID=4076 RepID=A0ABS8T7R6_DATST|nr:hypothetical protein [Datura stramonium]